ncbi:MAG: HAMP domain-containing histidine kinase [Clostridia bacterium]|nr:HAMP domain-containing histidine kinase [Clostridia bacterium]
MRKKKSKVQNSKYSIKTYFSISIMVSIVAASSIFLYAFLDFISNHNRLLSAIVGVVYIAVMTFICMVLDARTKHLELKLPLRTILDATERITNGDLSVRLEPIHPWGKFDEYDIIIENLNKMVISLSNNSVLKSDFISNVSHEIKTPIAIIQNYATALTNENIPQEKKKEYLSTLIETSKKLSNLVSNILKLNKLENQDIIIEKKEFELGEYVRENVLKFEELIENKNIELDCDIDDMKILSDESYIEIILNNLISNAIKFTNEKGHIFISLKKVEDYAILKVSDDGIGMSQAVGKRIFEKFYQGDTSHSQEGNGLGLALVKKVIEIIGGEISVESEPLKGTTFIVKLETLN